jgi:2-polyprenyl-3-methyl-5-hydroxy-6-metoxy-1,4-benzoquinol methylase
MSERTYYDRYWTSAPSHEAGWMQRQDPWEARCLARVLGAAKDVLRGRLLDAGCGDGTVAAALLPLPGVEQVVGIDLAEAAVRTARQRVPAAQFEVMSLDELRFADASFDAVLAIEVVEHILDVEQAFRELSRVIKPGGHLVITTTDFNWLKQVLVAAFFFDKYFYPTNPHIRFFTHRTLRQELTKVGLAEVRYRWNGSYAGIMPKGQIMIARRA